MQGHEPAPRLCGLSGNLMEALQDAMKKGFHVLPKERPWPWEGRRITGEMMGACQTHVGEWPRLASHLKAQQCTPVWQVCGPAITTVSISSKQSSAVAREAACTAGSCSVFAASTMAIDRSVSTLVTCSMAVARNVNCYSDCRCKKQQCQSLHESDMESTIMFSIACCLYAGKMHKPGMATKPTCVCKH